MRTFRPLSAIQDRDVVDPSGERVGYIHDLLVDLKDGRIEYICIALQGRPGNPPAEVVVPWSTLRILDGDRGWAVAAKKRMLHEIAQPVSRRK